MRISHLGASAIAYIETTDTDPVAEMVIIQSGLNGRSSATFSPDGRWIAYTENETLKMVPNPPYTNGPGGKVPIAPTVIGAPPFIGYQIAFSPDGTELLFSVGELNPSQFLWRGTLNDPTNPTALIDTRQISKIDFIYGKGLSWVGP